MPKKKNNNNDKNLYIHNILYLPLKSKLKQF